MQSPKHVSEALKVLRELKRKKARLTDNVKYSNFLTRARDKGKKVDISLKQYCKIIKDRKCFYCDSSFKLETGSNLNRVDSNKGYTLNNVKPCCAKCNTIMNNFTVDELRLRVYKIVRRMKKLTERLK